MARMIAELEQDLADAERLATMSVYGSVCRRMLEEVREREALLREAQGWQADHGQWLNEAGYQRDYARLHELNQRIAAIIGEQQ